MVEFVSGPNAGFVGGQCAFHRFDGLFAGSVGVSVVIMQRCL